ncbi:MAG TPA: DNA-binding response regulator, partial [Porphyromonadaceae bacterium]|nr:DNA-binding response regulator [Porphyromonadaceae bacterium]
IVDDEPLALSLLESYVEKTPFLKLTGKYSNAVSAMNRIEEEQVDVLFLDIQMPEVNGMEFARSVSANTRLIFTTAFSEYALQGYKVSALDYLLKPFSYADFLTAAKKALHWFEMTSAGRNTSGDENESGIFVKSEYKLIHILYDDILYIEGLKDYVKIYTESAGRPILSLMSLKTMEEKLPKNRFVRVHRSYIIRKDKIESISKNRIIIGNRQIPIGDTYRENFIGKLDK